MTQEQKNLFIKDFLLENPGRKFVKDYDDFFVHECKEHPVTDYKLGNEMPCMQHYKKYEY